MAGENKSDYQKAAARRWPWSKGWTVYGDGRIALVCDITKCVHLYDFFMIAKTQANENCSNWNCRNFHRLFEVTPEQPRRRARNIQHQMRGE